VNFEGHSKYNKNFNKLKCIFFKHFSWHR